jgi:hypothetical protein
MLKEEHKAILEQIKNASSDADRMGLLIQLEQDYTSVLTERDTATERATNAELESAKYAKLNNELWLQNSSQKKVGVETAGNSKDNNADEPPKKRTYEDLEKDFE